MKKRAEELFVIQIVLILTLGTVVGTRLSDFDRDYNEYARIFNLTINSGINFANLALYEPSLLLIPFFSKLLFGTEFSVKITFVIFALLAVSFKIASFKKSASFFLSAILYASYLLFGQEMTTIRAGVACAIFLYSIKDIANENNFGFFKKISVSFMFHYSSIVFLLAWFLVKVKLSIKAFYAMLFVSILIAVAKINMLTLLKLDIIFPKVRMYLDLMEILDEGPVNVFNFRILISVFFIFLFTYKRNTLNDKPYFMILLKIHMLSVILFFILSPTAMVFSLRVFDLLSVVQLLLYPMIIYIFKEKIIGYGIIFLVCALNLYYIIYVSQWFNTYSSWAF